MKYELPCAIVRDLLPSYVEGLTEAETSAAVKEHLKGCDDCRKRCESMSGGEEAAVPDEREVDYLKTVRRKNGKRVLTAAVLAVVLVLGCIGTHAFFIGAPAAGISVRANTVQEGNIVRVSFANLDSATTLVGWKTETVGDTVSITARKVLVSPFHSPQLSAGMEVDTTEVTKIMAFGQLIWQDGLEIDYHTNRLLENRTPYVGNASAVGNLISFMDLDSGCTMELQTAKEPYGVTLHFAQPIKEDRRFLMEGNAFVLLALVDNLGQVSWDDPSGYAGTLTLAEADAAVSDRLRSYNMEHSTDFPPLGSVKGYGTDSFGLQLLQNMLGI